MPYGKSIELLESADRRAGGTGPAKQTAFPSPAVASMNLQDLSGGAVLTVSIEHSVDGNTWTPVGSFPARSAPWSADEVMLNFTPSPASRLRAVWTLPGGSAKFQVDVRP